jgi:hypothetical protein
MPKNWKNSSNFQNHKIDPKNKIKIKFLHGWVKSCWFWCCAMPLSWGVPEIKRPLISSLRGPFMLETAPAQGLCKKGGDYGTIMHKVVLIWSHIFWGKYTIYYDSTSTLATLTLLIIIKFCRNVENFTPKK